jgi:uncharacterized protein
MILQPNFKLEYEGKDITADITRYATALSYTDAVTGESDEIQVTLQDLEGLWRGAWKPNKGDKIKFWIGYGSDLVDCGTFEVDELELSGPPDTVNFRGLATPVTSPLRTQNSKAYENISLFDIVNNISTKYSLSVQGEIPNIIIPRVTQGKETDLGFLNRIAQDYYMLFSIRGNILTFTQITEIEKSPIALEINRTDCMSYSLNDKTVEIPIQVNVGGTNAKTGIFMKAESAEQSLLSFQNLFINKISVWDDFRQAVMFGFFAPAYIAPDLANNFKPRLKELFTILNTNIKKGYEQARDNKGSTLDVYAKSINTTVNGGVYNDVWQKYIGKKYGETVKQAFDVLLAKLSIIEEKNKAYQDKLNLKNNVQTQQIADYKANAGAYVKKTRQVTGRLTVQGQPIALAGSNFKLLGFGRYDGICHIEKSIHNLSRSGGYVTDIEFKIVKQ